MSRSIGGAASFCRYFIRPGDIAMEPRARSRSSIPTSIRSRGLLMAQILVVALVGPALADGIPVVVADGSPRVRAGSDANLLVAFFAEEQPITGLVFSLDLDLERLDFDPTDGDGDGIPDRVRLLEGDLYFTHFDFDPTDEDGELDLGFAVLSGQPLPEGMLLKIQLSASRAGTIASWFRFSGSPAPSFGDDQGQSVPGDAVVLGIEIFADGFESGDLSAWSVLSMP